MTPPPLAPKSHNVLIGSRGDITKKNNTEKHKTQLTEQDTSIYKLILKMKAQAHLIN